MNRTPPDSSCEDGEGREAFLSSRYEDKGDGDDDGDEIPTKEQYVDVWLRPGLPPSFCDHMLGGHLEEQIRSWQSQADGKAVIEKQLSEVHLERMSTSSKVNIWCIGQRIFGGILLIQKLRVSAFAW